MEAILYHRQMGDLMTTSKQSIRDNKYHYGVQTFYQGVLVSDVVAGGFREAAVTGRAEFDKFRTVYAETDPQLVTKNSKVKVTIAGLTLEQKMEAKLARQAEKDAAKEAEKEAKRQHLAQQIAEATEKGIPLPTALRGKKKVFSVAQGEVIEA
jgi:hypothetical protein